MKPFTVTDVPVRFGEGTKLGLDAAQLASRAHNVTVLPAVDQTVEGFTIVVADRPLEFRTGETILIEGATTDVALVNPLTGQKQSGADRRRGAKKAPARKGAAKK